MRAEQRTVYITDDGREFDKPKEARRHELSVKLEWFYNGLSWRDIEPEDIAHVLITNAREFLPLLQEIVDHDL